MFDIIPPHVGWGFLSWCFNFGTFFPKLVVLPVMLTLDARTELFDV